MTEESESVRKVVINGQHGGFSLSPPALLWLYSEGMTGIATPVDEYWTEEDDGGRFSKSHALARWREYLASPESQSHFGFLTVFSPDEKFVLDGGRNVQRDDPLLLGCVEALGSLADGACARLRVVEIPADAAWEIDEYDGLEWVAEKHRRWS